MNILVVTLWDSYNFGSYLQAACLNEVLAKWGNVYILDISARNPYKSAFYTALHNVRNKDFLGVYFEIHKLYNFLKSQRETFKTIKPNEIKRIGIDVAVFGSDEIWNIKRIETGKLSSAFWGDGIHIH